MNKKNGKSFTLAFSLVEATYWMTSCAIFSYAAVYLQSLSFSNFAIGIITALGQVFGAVIGPEIATYLDRHPEFPTARMNTPLILLEMLLLFVLLKTGKNDFLTGFLFATVAGLFFSTNSVNLRFRGDSEVAGFTLNYGISRGIGSLSFVIPTILLGQVFKRVSASYLPVAAVILLSLQLLANAYAGSFLKGRKSVSAETETGDSLFRFLYDEPVFTRLLIGNILLFFGLNAYEIFVINVVKNVGGDTATMGLLSGYGAAVEIPAMFLLSKLRKKWKISTLLSFSLIVFSVKALSLSLVSSVPGLFAAQTLQAMGYALYAAAVVEYVAAVIPIKNQAKGQSLIYTMEMIGGVISGFVAGKLYDVTSVRNTLLCAFAVSVAGTVLAVSGIKKAD